MAIHRMAGCFVLALLLLIPLSSISAADTAPEVYVVHLGDNTGGFQLDAVLENTALLATVLGSVEAATGSILYHYRRTFRGFAAKLDLSHVAKLKESEKVVGVFKSLIHKPHTSHSWNFLRVLNFDSSDILVPGTNDTYYFPPASQTDTIIGMLDSGYWPESASFQDVDFPPVPLRWKGACVAGDQFAATLCNNKVIGARYYYQGALAAVQAQGGTLQDILSARDTVGHGSHTASTVAGGRYDATQYGIGEGVVSGGVSGARLAIYKVCFTPAGCTDADILAGFDDAIADGVDIISISIGNSNGEGDVSLLNDGIAFGSYHAVKNNVLVSASAGNSGPDYGTVVNTAPWIFTVAASTTDREYVTNVQLGDGSIIPGGWVFNPFQFSSQAPIVLSSNAAIVGVSQDQAKYYVKPGSTVPAAFFCVPSSLDPQLVTGAIVVCEYDPTVSGAEDEVRQAGGLGIILVGTPTAPREFVGPATFISTDAANQALQLPYLQNTATPVGVILPTAPTYGQVPAPRVAAFSSRGPSLRNPDIPKPDITAPGQAILAAFSPLEADAFETGGRSLALNIISGTSMACPHITAISALIKIAHPGWSPAAIKSAIMTTATRVDNFNMTITTYPSLTSGGPLDFGSGHAYPLAALDPGLVYDVNFGDYVDFICNFGVTDAELRLFTGDNVATCPVAPTAHYDINYPAIKVSHLVTPVTVTRSVTNVGSIGVVTYMPTVIFDPSVLVQVDPPALSFQFVGQTLSFTVTFTPPVPATDGITFWGYLIWSDGYHNVASPLTVTPASF